jgi:hypothetical protein
MTNMRRWRNVMGEKEPQATRMRGVLDGSSIFFLRRDSGKRYSSISSASPVIACRAVDLFCDSRIGFLFTGWRKGEQVVRKTGGVLDLSEEEVVSVAVEEPDGWAFNPRGE